MSDKMELESKLGYKFKDESLLERALTHSSYANERKDKSVHSNERLEFLGDSVLGMVVASELYRRYSDMPEGKMTQLRARLVCEESLHNIALEIGLGESMRFGKGEERSGGRTRPSILADAVEALIAALYLDGGADRAAEFIKEQVLKSAEQPFIGTVDYKTKLQELVQREGTVKLSYKITGETGPDHNKEFCSAVYLNGQVIGEGVGRTKKEAEQAAARGALEDMENEQGT